MIDSEKHPGIFVYTLNDGSISFYIGYIQYVLVIDLLAVDHIDQCLCGQLPDLSNRLVNGRQRRINHWDHKIIIISNDFHL